MALSKLGRSFSELIEQNRLGSAQEWLEVPLSQIKTNARQPRKSFDDITINELSQSIKVHGLLQPLVVVKKGDDYELVAGERRLRALQKLGWKNVPVRLVSIDENHQLQAALVENIQRQDLNPIECALAYKELITRFGLTQQQLANQLGKERSTLANTLRLLELPQNVQHMLEKGELSMGHARALLSLKSPDEIEQTAQKIINESLNVRSVEQLTKTKSSKEPKKDVTKDPNVKAAEEELCHALGTKVAIKHNENKGRIVIEYYSLDDFDRIKKILSK